MALSSRGRRMLKVRAKVDAEESRADDRIHALRGQLIKISLHFIEGSALHISIFHPLSSQAPLSNLVEQEGRDYSSLSCLTRKQNLGGSEVICSKSQGHHGVCSWWRRGKGAQDAPFRLLTAADISNRSQNALLLSLDSLGSAPGSH